MRFPDMTCPNNFLRPALKAAALGSALALVACSNAKQPNLPNMETYRTPQAMASSGNGGLGTLFTFGGKSHAEQTGVAVNAYLWRASLVTLSFMPLASADPFAGVIVTDWYSPPAKPDRRFKVSAYVLGTTLTANNLKVSVFEQDRQGGAWVDQPVDPAVANGLEDRILARAAQLKAAGQLNG
ncbi:MULTISPECIES: DUF3576 domain-containing protein [Acidiphilium]|uniref:DUF3576 domain-containing protein n=2 Tax=Acidocellaceae TaxID=3385905 RepID=A5G069_ACICJ|nr:MULTISPECIES: DUF3576 domain-containing protein [Acidiphilium]MDE2327591.1 DUF3576 domain-containing protein [Rhodospirillales bacterium]UNC13633.1 DUF3576 domain-containing protein [Acidiphilium multivorum]ABQ31251.1 hypothetical protein Acry_2051 [Acidiphilium cryptum JF-5]EGO93982.1 hypothetical protein APM_3235 [Acidiphilium sp. PM]KDM66618.1 hypothetical protein DUF3576 [Acidiphilium sp. JA12-A1]